MISIIIPVYNAGNYIRDCLESVRVQTYTDFEVICVNDGSIDNSDTICSEFVNIDSRFSLINQANAGVSVARNTGLDKAQGEYVCFVDADDIIAPQYLQTFWDIAQQGDFAYCGFTMNLSLLGSGSSKTKALSAKEFLNNVATLTIEHPNLWAMIFRTDIISKHNIRFTPGCVRNEDTEFYVMYLLHVDRVILIDYAGYYYREDNPSSAMKRLNMKTLTALEAAKRMGNTLVEHCILEDKDVFLNISLQSYIFNTARQSKQDMFDYLHANYNIPKAMKSMLNNAKFKRRLLAFVYLVLGKQIFYKFMSIL